MMLNAIIFQEEVAFVIDGHGYYSVLRKTGNTVEIYDPMRHKKDGDGPTDMSDLLYLLVNNEFCYVNELYLILQLIVYYV